MELPDERLGVVTTGSGVGLTAGAGFCTGSGLATTGFGLGVLTRGFGITTGAATGVAGLGLTRRGFGLL